MEKFARLLAWADAHQVRIVLKMIPDQRPSVFVIEAQVPRPAAGKDYFQFVRRRGKTIEEVSGEFLKAVE